MKHEDLEKFRQPWDQRRPLIKKLLLFVAGVIIILLLGAIGLAVFSKFLFAVAAFFIVAISLSFMTLLGIIGSYVFAAKWENSDFLNAIPGIVSALKGQEDEPSGFTTNSDTDENSIEIPK
jgi:CHASE3 domain sensor protein